MTAEVPGNYTNFKQKLVEVENFVTSKVNNSQQLFAKCHSRAGLFQSPTTAALLKEMKLETKQFPKKPSFSDNFCEKTGL